MKTTWVIRDFNHKDYEQYLWVVKPEDKIIFTGHKSWNAAFVWWENEYVGYLPGEKVLLPNRRYIREELQIYQNVYDEIKTPSTVIRLKVHEFNKVFEDGREIVAKIGLSNDGHGDYVMHNIKVSSLPPHKLLNINQLAELIKLGRV